MDEKDRLLLTYLQNGLPLTPRPFEAWASKLGTDSADLLVRLQRLKREGLFGSIKAILDPSAFGYRGAWVALEHGAPDRTDALWQHPGVIYGCEREHALNIWFFITAPEGHDLQLHVRCLEKIAGAQQALFLPVRRVFKGTDPLTFPDVVEKRKPASCGVLTPGEIDMIRQLQEPFPFTDEPYKRIAAELRITEVEVLERMKSLVQEKCLKRIGAPLKPSLGIQSSGTLVVWQIPEEKLERIGSDLLAFEEVLYADRRPAYPEFPYSLYTTIQAETDRELEAVTRRFQDHLGKWPHRVLTTIREFKKESMHYFPRELDLWWRERRHMAETAFN